MTEIEILVLVLSLEGLLFIVIGYAMPAMPPSRWVGVRFPQTRADERVWRDTHERTGPRFRRMGAVILVSGVMLVALPIPDALALGVFAVIAIGALGWLVVDSWRYSKRRLAHYREVDAGRTSEDSRGPAEN